MHLTKAEMEDIWLNKPAGYFASIKKTIKSRKVFVVTLQPYKTMYSEKVAIEVTASTKSSAEWTAKQEYAKKCGPEDYTSTIVHSVVQKTI